MWDGGRAPRERGLRPLPSFEGPILENICANLCNLVHSWLKNMHFKHKHSNCGSPERVARANYWPLTERA